MAFESCSVVAGRVQIPLSRSFFSFLTINYIKISKYFQFALDLNNCHKFFFIIHSIQKLKVAKGLGAGRVTASFYLTVSYIDINVSICIVLGHLQVLQFLIHFPLQIYLYLILSPPPLSQESIGIP